MERPTVGKPTSIAVVTAAILVVVAYFFYPEDPVVQFSAGIIIFAIYLTWFLLFFTDWIYEIE